MISLRSCYKKALNGQDLSDLIQCGSKFHTLVPPCPASFGPFAPMARMEMWSWRNSASLLLSPDLQWRISSLQELEGTTVLGYCTSSIWSIKSQMQAKTQNHSVIIYSACKKQFHHVPAIHQKTGTCSTCGSHQSDRRHTSRFEHVCYVSCTGSNIWWPDHWVNINEPSNNSLGKL